MIHERDLSLIELDEDQSATINTNVYEGERLIAIVDVVITVLKAEDGHLTLAVHQDTRHGINVEDSLI